MKRLTLLRHAKSGWQDPVKRDFDRPLNDRGRKAAATMGAFMRRESMAFDLVIASPAVRVRQTLEGVEDGLGAPLGPLFDTRLYMASAALLLEVAQSVPETVERLLLVGHNPGLEDLALMLVPPGEALRGEVEEKYPTATLAELAIDAPRWADLAAGGGRLLRFTRPRDLDPSLGPDES